MVATQGESHSTELLGTQAEHAKFNRRTAVDLANRVRLFDAPELKDRINAAIEHAESHGQMHDALWPHQQFALTLGELLRAAKRGA